MQENGYWSFNTMVSLKHAKRIIDKVFLSKSNEHGISIILGETFIQLFNSLK